MSYYTPVLNELGLNKDDQSQYTSLLFDLEGHEDIQGLIEAMNIPTQNGVTLVAHSMGCLIASLFASQHSDVVSRLVLIGPAPCPLPAAGADGSIKRAATVRAEDMRKVALTVAAAATSVMTKSDRPLAFTAMEMILLSHDPEGYAKGCTALAGAKDLNIDFAKLGKSTKSLIIAGEEDKILPPAHAQKLTEALGSGEAKVLPDVGHWHVFEDVEGVAKAMKTFLF